MRIFSFLCILAFFSELHSRPVNANQTSSYQTFHASGLASQLQFGFSDDQKAVETAHKSAEKYSLWSLIYQQILNCQTVPTENLNPRDRRKNLESFYAKRGLSISLSNKNALRIERSSKKLSTHRRRKLYECVSEDIQITTSSSNRERCPFVLALSDDRIVTLWYSSGTTASIKGQLLDINLNEIGSEFVINSGSNIPAISAPRATLLQTGSYAVTWRSNSDNAIVRIMTDDEAGLEFQANYPDIEINSDPDICSSADGTFWVVWGQTSDTYFSIFGRGFDDSGSYNGNSFETFAPETLTGARCTISSSGSPLTSYDLFEINPNGTGVYLYLPEQLMSIQVNTFVDNDQEFSSIATLNDGKFIIVWQSEDQDGSSNGIYAQLYDSAANPIGIEFQVNTETENNQATPEVIGLYDGGFLVTWLSFNQDGDRNGLYGQRYDANANIVDLEFQINEESTDSQICSRSYSLFNGFVSAWETTYSFGTISEIFIRAFYDTNTVTNADSCETCSSNQRVISNTCSNCRDECASCDGDDCRTCNDSSFSSPGCCPSNGTYSGSTCSVAPTNQYYSGSECLDCDEKCATCDSLGCLTCIVNEIDCCGPYRALQSDLVTCDCPSECTTCDSTGCLACTSGETCCPTSRYYDVSTSTCLDCATSDGNGCLTCPTDSTACCPNGRFYNAISLTCEDCESPCATCTSSADCMTCESGTSCCGEGRFLDGICTDCLSECATCSSASSCDICTDPDVSSPECCPDSTQDDLNQDGYCECLDGNTARSGCSCPEGYVWYWIGSAFSCIGPMDITPLTLEGPSGIGTSCTEDLEIFVTDYSDLQSDNINTIKFRWFSDASSLSELLRSQVSNPLIISSAVLPEGTTTFTVYMNIYGVIFSGTYSLTKSTDLDLEISISPDSLITLSTEESVIVSATVSSQPCSSVTFDWTNIDSVRRLQLPSSSSDSLVVPSNTLPAGVHTYTFTATSGSASFTNSVILVVTSVKLSAVIDSVGTHVSAADNLTLNGSNSYDPTDSSGSFSFFWSCTPASASTCPSFSVFSDSQLTISASELVEGMSFAITLTVNKGTRTDSTAVFLTVTS